MERIDKNYLFVCQLKELLHDFNLPRINVYTPDTVPRETRLYIKDGWVVRCEKVTVTSEGFDCNFKKLYEYAYNWPEVNFTKNLIINSSIYDEYTHEYFGDYLRFLRDYHKVNLMGMYNCFFYQRPNRIYHIFKDGGKTIYKIDTDNKNYNYYIVPVKFDQLYTISIDSSLPYELTCILYNNMFINNTPLELVKESLMTVPSSKVKKPFLYSTQFDCVNEHWRKEKDLKLVLKLPKSVESSITILEGNYKDQAEVLDFELVPEFIYNTEEKYTVIDYKGDEIERIRYLYPTVYGSKNSLLQVNNHNSYPLSERMLEYIIGCVIYPLDGINKNTERVQRSDMIRDYRSYGMWDDRLRYKIYQSLLKEDKSGSWKREKDSEGNLIYRRYIDNYEDLTGYVDKDVESILGLNTYE